LSSDRPFWFATENLLLDLLRVEIHSILELFASHSHLREFFDAPEATPQQRASCFAVLAHRNLMDAIYETFAGRHEQSPSLGDDEKHALRLTRNLVATDAPSWVLEVDQVAELLPSRIYDALPEPLRRGGFNAHNEVESKIISAAASELGSVEHIQALTDKVLAQQLRRLKGRWSLHAVQLGGQTGPKESKRSFKGTEGLGHKKADLSKYTAEMTDKQRLAFSLKYEYALRLTAIASRMGIDRTTAREHLDAANRKLEHNRAFEKRKTNRSKSNFED
jgi:hypothetical protein